MLVRTSHGEGCYPVCNLRFLEYDAGGELFPEKVKLEDVVVTRTKRPQRKAAAAAQERFLAIHLLTVGVDP